MSMLGVRIQPVHYGRQRRIPPLIIVHETVVHQRGKRPQALYTALGPGGYHTEITRRQLRQMCERGEVVLQGGDE